MAQMRASATADCKSWFTPPKKDALYLLGRKRRNILGKTTVNDTRYRSRINKLEAEVINKGLYNDKIYSQHDNAKSHIAKIIKEKIAKLVWELLLHPPYSPDVAPSDYHLFRSLSIDLRGRKFKNEEDLKRYLQDFFDSKSKELYARGIRDLPRRWKYVFDK